MRKSTRREFLQVVSAWSAVGPAMAARRRKSAGNGTQILAYVGTYSSPEGPNHGQGIHIFEMNPASGALAPVEIVRSESNPSWLTFNRTRTHLYAANEVADPKTGSGLVSAFAVDRATGRLTLLNTVSSEGAGPAHMSIHPAGKHALVANYGGGSLAVLPIQRDGRLPPRPTSSAIRVPLGRCSRPPLRPAASPSAGTIDPMRT
jgi:6-phosphogluconolactonase